MIMRSFFAGQTRSSDPRKACVGWADLADDYRARWIGYVENEHARVGVDVLRGVARLHASGL
jgi:hypothetical protein